MLKNLFTKDDEHKANPKVVADLKRNLTLGDKVGFFHGGDLLGKSLLVAIEDEHILFEALTPVDDLLRASEIASIQRGIPWDFKVRHLEEITEGKDSYIKCSIPSAVNINSRRDNFRVPVPVSSHYEIAFSLEEKRFTAKILDLSNTGAQIRIASNSEFNTDEQALIHDAVMQLAEDLECPVRFQVRWVHYLPETARMGIEFVGLKPAEEDAVHRIVHEIEREIIRKTRLLKK